MAIPVVRTLFAGCGAPSCTTLLTANWRPHQTHGPRPSHALVQIIIGCPCYFCQQHWENNVHGRHPTWLVIPSHASFCHLTSLNTAIFGDDSFTTNDSVGWNDNVKLGHSPIDPRATRYHDCLPLASAICRSCHCAHHSEHSLMALLRQDL